MKPTLTPPLHTLALVATWWCATAPASAQYAPPPPTQPFPGFANDWLRKQDPYNANWDISGATRLRYEGKSDAGFTLGGSATDFRGDATFDNDNIYFLNKTLARIAYTSEWWSIYVEGRNSDSTDDDRAPNAESDGLVDLHQAFFTVGNHKEFPVSLKLGRQELSYGDERLVGAFAWNNIGRVFDSAKLRWQNGWGTLEAFTGKIVLPDDNNFNTWNDYNVFSGAHFLTKRIPKNTSEFFLFARNEGVGVATANPGSFAPFLVGAPAARDIYTLGFRIKSNPGDFGNWDYTVEAAGQWGSWKPALAAARQDHEAFAFMANVGYTFPDTFGTPRVALEYAYASGDSNNADGKHTTFDNLYPTNHKFYGYMDLASWQNLHDVRAIYQMKPHARLSLALEGHLFWLADTADRFYNVAGVARGGAAATPGTGFGINSNYSSFVGAEIDFVAGFILNKFTNLEAGYGHFFRGDYLKQTWSAIGSKDADWFYLQTVIRF